MALTKRINRRICIELDGSCRRCGSPDYLEPHHIIHTSQGGGDELWNLITLCHTCHMLVQGGYWDEMIFHTERSSIIHLLKSYRGNKGFRWKESLEWWMKGKEKDEKRANN